MFGEEESEFRRVPPEIIFEIMAFLPLPDKKVSRLVCQRWRWILDDSRAGRLNFRAIINDSNSKFLLNSCLYFANVRVSDVRKWPSMTHSRNQFPQIKKAKLGWTNSEEAIMTFLSYGCANVESLKILENSLANAETKKIARLIPQVKWNYLTCLNLCVKISYWPQSKKCMTSIKKHIDSVVLFLELAKAPKLTKLTFSLADSRYGRSFDGRIVKLYTELHRFLDRHSNTLKILELRLYLNQEMEFMGCQVMVSSEILESLKHNLQLESLVIRVSHFGSLVALAPTCLWEQDKLQLLTVDHCTWNLNGFFFVEDGGIRDVIRTMIGKNQNTLISLTVASRSRNATFFEIDWLENCSALKMLSLRGFDEIWNTNISLPTITHFEVWPFQILPLNFDTWIVQSLKAVEIVKILSKSLLFSSRAEIWRMDVSIVKNLLTLPKILEVRYASLGYISYHYDNQILNFCHTSPNLLYFTNTNSVLHINGIMDATEKVVKRVATGNLN